MSTSRQWWQFWKPKTTYTPPPLNLRNEKMVPIPVLADLPTWERVVAWGREFKMDPNGYDRYYAVTASGQRWERPAQALVSRWRMTPQETE